METITMTTISLDLSAARQLRDGLATLLRAEQAAMADFLVALADFDRRRGWEPLGHASLFAFLHAELGLSNSASFWRMSAARLLQRFPDLIEPLGDGRLCLSTTAELAKVLTEENRAEVAPRFFGLSAREAREVVAELTPRETPPLRALVTAVDRPGTRAELPLALATPHSPTPAEASRADTYAGLLLTSEVAPTRPARDAARRDDVEPLTAELRRLHITVDRQFLKMLNAARDGLSHSIPGASTEQVLKAALELLLEKQAKARGLVKKPRTFATPSSTPTLSDATTATPTFSEPLHRRTGPREQIPAAVRRAVWERDGGRCTWPLDSGGCCGSTHRLELDHIDPWARFSEPTVDNLRVVCHHHNTLAARQIFGARCVERYVGRRAMNGA
jgi:hypothetical protein